MDSLAKAFPDLFVSRENIDLPVIMHRAIDRIWQEICCTAASAVQHESLLTQRMHNLVLERLSLFDSLAMILAHELACDDLAKAKLYSTMLDIFSAEQLLQGQITADLAAVKSRDPACHNHLHVLLNMKGFHALETYRISYALWKQGRKDLAYALASRASIIFSVDIHPAAQIGSGVMLDHGTGIVIGETAIVEDNVSILQNVTLGGTGKDRGDRHPKIRTGVMIGAGAIILGNIEIGAMSKVGAGSVVLNTIPSHCTVAGVPAKIVRRGWSDKLPAFDMDQSLGPDDELSDNTNKAGHNINAS